MKLLLKGHGVRIPFPETPGVKLRIVFFYTDEGRKQFRTNIIVLFGYRVGHALGVDTVIIISQDVGFMHFNCLNPSKSRP